MKFNSVVASKRQRTQFTSDQLRRLEEMFQNVQYPDPIQRSEISTELGILELQVKNWFQNRRAKLKKDYWTARQRMDQACYPKTIAIPCGLPCLVNGPEGFHEQTECTYCQSLPVTARPTALGNQWVQHRVTVGNTQYYDPGPYVSNYSNYCTFQRASQQDISTVIDANERVQVCNKDATEVKPTTINGKTRSYAHPTDSYRTNEKLRNLDQREINGQFRGQNFCRYQPGFCKLEPIVIE